MRRAPAFSTAGSTFVLERMARTQCSRTTICCSRTGRRSTPSPGLRSSLTRWRASTVPTVGQLDETALYYLRSRGIAADEHVDSSSTEFADQAVDDVGIETVRHGSFTGWATTMPDQPVSIGATKGFTLHETARSRSCPLVIASPSPQVTASPCFRHSRNCDGDYERGRDGSSRAGRLGRLWIYRRIKQRHRSERRSIQHRPGLGGRNNCLRPGNPC